MRPNPIQRNKEIAPAISNAADSVRKNGLITRLAMATSLLLAGITGCSSDANVNKGAVGVQESSDDTNDLDTAEKKMDALREKLALEPLNSLDASGLGHANALNNLTPAERRQRLAHSEKEVSKRLDDLDEHLKIIPRKEAPSYKK